MTEPQPSEHFLDLLLQSEEVVAACKAALGERSDDVIARAARGDTTDFIEWFEEWRLNDWGEPVEQLEGAAPDNDTFSINIYKSGPLYWIKANEFDAICYFDSADDALAHSADEFEGFISELADREVGEGEQ